MKKKISLDKSISINKSFEDNISKFKGVMEIDNDLYLKMNSALNTGFVENMLYKNDLNKLDFNSKDLSSYWGFGSKDFTTSLLMYNVFQQDYRRKYGYIPLNKEFVQDMAGILKNDLVLDMGAGSGFLAKCLNDLNIDIVAVDLYKENNRYVNEHHYHIIEADGLKFLEEKKSNFDTVILSWPEMTDFSEDLIDHMLPNQKLIYIGEEGGCNAPNSFFEKIALKAEILKNETNLLNASHRSFPMLRDKCVVYKIK